MPALILGKTSFSRSRLFPLCDARRPVLGHIKNFHRLAEDFSLVIAEKSFCARVPTVDSSVHIRRKNCEIPHVFNDQAVPILALELVVRGCRANPTSARRVPAWRCPLAFTPPLCCTATFSFEHGPGCLLPYSRGQPTKWQGEQDGGENGRTRAT